jgi:hypothetical protein
VILRPDDLVETTETTILTKVIRTPYTKEATGIVKGPNRLNQ